jgi:hypothetical protein
MAGRASHPTSGRSILPSRRRNSRRSSHSARTLRVSIACYSWGTLRPASSFFVFDLREVDEDIRYLQERYFAPTRFHAVEVTKVTRLKQQRVILGLCHYRYCDAATRQLLAAKAQQAARVCAKPVYIFREL